MDFYKRALALREETISHRRWLHSNAEVGLHMPKGQTYVMEQLRGYGLDPHPCGHGVIAELGQEGGRTILLRADMDALPMPEESGESFSCPTGTEAHTCGHDFHAAMLLTAAKILKENESMLSGRVRFMFQPAEETLFGALKSYDDGVLDDVDYAFGAHVRPIQDIPDGTVCAAVRHTSSTFCIVELKGKVAHGSRPHLGASVVEAAVLATNAVNSLWVNPNKAWSAKVTSIDCASTATNIIPDKGKMILDIRAQDNETMTELLEKLKTAITNACACVNVTCEITFPGGVIPAAVYDEDLVDQVRKTIGEVLGEEKVAKDCGGGGEDFHYFKQKKPELHAAYIGVGTGVTPGLHDPRMTMNPESLRNGVKVLEKLILNVVG